MQIKGKLIIDEFTAADIENAHDRAQQIITKTITKQLITIEINHSVIVKH